MRRTSIICFSIFVLMMLVISCSRKDTQKSVKADCDINIGSCVRKAHGLNVSFEIYPRPVRSMREVSFGVRLKRGDKPVNNAKVTADFTMPGMFMGKNYHTLTHVGKGVYRSQGVLPRCPEGGKLWRSEVTVSRAREKPVSVTYLFEVD
jgi:hypothetical protein